MTLVELIISVAIMTVIVGAMALMVTFVARSTSPTSQATNQADDTMLASSYWAQDVGNSQTFSTTGAPCGSGSTIAWLKSPQSGAPYASSVVYSYSAVYSGTLLVSGELDRTDCLTGQKLILVRNLNPDASQGFTAEPTCLNGASSPKQLCNARAFSTGIQLVLPLLTPGAQNNLAGVVRLTGAWMLSCPVCVASETE